MWDIEHKILEWHSETFPNATLKAVIEKLKEEVMEAHYSLAFNDLQSALEECADVFIVACAVAARRDLFEDNVSMSRVIADKLAVIKARTWGPEDSEGDRPRVK